MRGGGNNRCIFDCNWFQGSLRPRKNDVGDTLTGSLAAITHNDSDRLVLHRFGFIEVAEPHFGGNEALCELRVQM